MKDFSEVFVLILHDILQRVSFKIRFKNMYINGLKSDKWLDWKKSSGWNHSQSCCFSRVPDGVVL